MASPAFQEDAFQNLTAHGIKGFQVTDSDAGGGGAGNEYVQKHHHFYAGWLLPACLALWERLIRL